MNESVQPSAVGPGGTETAPPAQREEPVREIAQPSSGLLFRRIFPSIMLPMFMAVADQTIVATALPDRIESR
jgi:hypothetical protein